MKPIEQDRPEGGGLDAFTLEQHGDFLVGHRDWENASEDQSERSRMARRADGDKRAPVTTNYRVWASDPAHWDYPGVDTPRAAPNLLPRDLMTGMYARSTTNVRTTDAPEHGSDPPVDPIGREEVAGEHARGEAVRRGVSAGTLMEDPRGRVGMSAIGGYSPVLGGESDRMDLEERDPIPSSALESQAHALESSEPVRREGETEYAGDRDDITFIYETTPGLSGKIELHEFGAHVRRKKRKMGDIADDFAAASLVASDLEKDL